MVRPRAPQASSSSTQPWRPGNITNHGSVTPGPSEASSLRILSREDPAPDLQRWEVNWHPTVKTEQEIFTNRLGHIFYKEPKSGILYTTEKRSWLAVIEPETNYHYFWNLLNNNCAWEFDGLSNARVKTNVSILKSQPPPAPPERVNKVKGSIYVNREVYLWAHTPGRQISFCRHRIRDKCSFRSCKFIHRVSNYSEHHLKTECEKVNKHGIDTYDWGELSPQQKPEQDSESAPTQEPKCALSQIIYLTKERLDTHHKTNSTHQELPSAYQ